LLKLAIMWPEVDAEGVNGEAEGDSHGGPGDAQKTVHEAEGDEGGVGDDDDHQAGSFGQGGCCHVFSQKKRAVVSP
jgi:hypothetical protein